MLPVSTKGPMVRYETLVLATPEITSQETTALESEIAKLVRKYNGNLLSFDRWGKMLLSYPVRKNDYGVYFLSRFEVEDGQGKSLLHDLHLLYTVKLLSFVMRNVFAKLDASASLEYQRPDSLEDTPTRDVGTFLRENKMEGMFSSVSQDDQDIEDFDMDKE